MRYYTEEELFETVQYPAGEKHYRLASYITPKHFDEEVVVEAHVRDFNGLCRVKVEEDILRNMGVVTTSWFIPYFPYARHDRRNDRMDGLELGVAMKLMGGFRFFIADPHSDVTGIISHIPQRAAVDVFYRYDAFDSNSVFAIPDQGAEKKAYSWLQSKGNLVVHCRKTRNPQTGRLSGFEVLDVFPKGSDVVIVDDICDAGGTFIGLGKQLKEMGAGRLTLCVTHGLFTKGLGPIYDVFDRVVTFCKTGSSLLHGEGVGGDHYGELTLIPFRDLFETMEFI